VARAASPYPANLAVPRPRQKTSRPFLENHERLLYFAEVARRSQCRPSQLLELTGMPAYLLDCAAAEALAAREREKSEAPASLIEW
jgi:hypothetical protein